MVKKDAESAVKRVVDKVGSFILSNILESVIVLYNLLLKINYLDYNLILSRKQPFLYIL